MADVCHQQDASDRTLRFENLPASMVASGRYMLMPPDDYEVSKNLLKALCRSFDTDRVPGGEGGAFEFRDRGDGLAVYLARQAGSDRRNVQSYHAHPLPCSPRLKS